MTRGEQGGGPGERKEEKEETELHGFVVMEMPLEWRPHGGRQEGGACR